MCENNKTGLIRPFPLIYRGATDSDAKEQLFGVSLIESCRYHKTEVPWIIQEGVELLRTIFKDYDLNNLLAAWLLSVEVTVEELYEARTFMNRPLPIATEILKEKFAFKPQLLLAVIRRYFMELPTSLIPADEYNTFKSLYLSSKFFSSLNLC